MEDIPEYAQFIDPKYSEQLMSESMPDEDLPSMSLPRKGPAAADRRRSGSDQLTAIVTSRGAPAKKRA